MTHLPYSYNALTKNHFRSCRPSWINNVHDIFMYRWNKQQQTLLSWLLPYTYDIVRHKNWEKIVQYRIDHFFPYEIFNSFLMPFQDNLIKNGDSFFQKPNNAPISKNCIISQILKRSHLLIWLCHHRMKNRWLLLVSNMRGAEHYSW